MTARSITVIGMACVVVLAAATASLAPFGAAAQAYPERPIRLLVPYAAGGGTDSIVATRDANIALANAQLTVGSDVIVISGVELADLTGVPAPSPRAVSAAGALLAESLGLR